MIKYNLVCKCGKTFESWFLSSSEFDSLYKKKLIKCIYCESSLIKKSVMAPNLSSKSNKIQIMIGDHLVTEQGKIAKNYNESDVKQYMKWDSIDIGVNLNVGSASYTVYTCDFTHDYIDINANYRN